MVGLIKAVLALRHEAVPPQVHFSKLNPHISLAGTRLAIPTVPGAWPAGALPRCAAVSSFGVGGTNAHVIVEEAPKLAAAPAEAARGCLHVLPLSAQSPAALQALAQSWIAFSRRRRPPRSPISATPPRCGARTTITGLRWSAGRRKS